MPELDNLQLIKALRRENTAHKGDNGKVLLIGGDQGMAGALALSAKASLFCGAGWTVLMMLDALSSSMMNQQPELMVHNARIIPPKIAIQTLSPDVIAIGPGLGQSDLAQEWLIAALQWIGPLIIDADGLNLLANQPELMALLQQRAQPSTLTPHPGEAARLLGSDVQEVQNDRTLSLIPLSQMTQCHVVLKGHHTLITSPNQDVYICKAGNAGMAVGGMGDVLTGCIAALAAQGLARNLNLWQATALGVELHARAADMMLKEGVGPIGMTPSELTIYLRQLINLQLLDATKP